MTPPPFSIIRDCKIHDTVRIIGWANLYQCVIHEDAFIGPFVEIGRGAVIGERTRISSHSYICDGTHIGNDCFIAHGVLTCNDDFSRPERYQHIGEMSAGWEFKRLTIGNSVRIGSGAVLLPVNIGDYAVIGAGAVVCEDVPAGAVVKGVPAREKVTKGPQ